MKQQIQRIIERNNNHPDKNNEEGKKSYLIDIINKLEGKHLDWLINVIEEKYNSKLNGEKDENNN